MADRVAAACAFLAQSPPGEINDVFSDLRVLVDDDAALEAGIMPALEAHNVEQLIVASSSTPEKHQMIIASAGRLPGQSDRFADPRSRQSFAFDHMRVKLSDPQPLDVNDATEAERVELEREAEAYTAEHYASGACAVFPASYPAPAGPVSVEEPSAVAPAAADEPPMSTDGEPAESSDDQPASDAIEVEAVSESAAVPAASPPPAAEPTPAVRTFTLAIVGNKYSPNNFWTGRWRSLYTIDHERGTVEGTIALQTHYFEAGNVQLATRKTVAIDSGVGTAKDAIKRIAAAEKAYQLALNEAYADMTERTFKELRRALPVHKQKIDWARITSYRIRSELKRSEA